MKSDVEHPKLGKVVDMVKNILEKNKDERIIIFAQYRDTVEKIVNLLTQNGIKAIRFIGQANKEGKGMSQKEQIEAIERFKKEGSVLVSTSVSEEGIDIPSVNYIIFYEPVPSEIRFIQRRGRAMRGEGGKVYVLIAKGTADEAYYRSALYKEREMKRLLKNMCYLLNKRLQKKFEEKSKEEIKEETEEIKEKEIESKTAVKEETKEEEEKTKKPVTILDFIKQIEVKERSKSEEDKIKQEIKIPKKPIKIIVDVREKNMAKLLHNYANIELKTLEVGDYVLSDRVVVERKTAEDFVNSIIDKRLFSQLKKS